MKTMRLLVSAMAVWVVVNSSLTLAAQNIEPTRYEFELSSLKQEVHALPIDEQGVVLFFENLSHDSLRQTKWNFLLIDTNLRDKQNVSFVFGGHQTLTTTFRSTTDAIWVFNSKQKDDSTSIQVVDYNYSKSSFVARKLNLDIGSRIVSAAALDSSLLLTIATNNGGYALITDVRSWNIRRVDFGLINDYSVFKTDVVDNRFVVALKVFNKRKFEKTIFVSINKNGDVTSYDELANKNNSSMGRFCFATDGQGHLIVLATIETETDKKMEMKDVNMELERSTYGVCFAKFADTATIRYYAFNKLPRNSKVSQTQNVVQYTTKDEGKRAASPNYQLLPPQLVRLDTSLVFIGEAYAYEYRPETHIGYDFYGRSYPYTYYVFEGYNFFNTFIITFDYDGNITWTTNLNFSEPISHSLESNVSGSTIDSILIFASALKNEVRYKVFDHDGKVLINNENTNADFFYANDELSNEQSSNIEKWFANSLIMYGCQTIDNGRLVGKNKRNVFFVQRLDFR